MAEVTISDLIKTYPDGTIAVKDLNLTIPDGKFLILLGPSGCGKTTTLRCVAGLEVQSEGDIRIGSTLVNDMKPGERDIAFVFQFYALYPHLNVYANIAFPLKASKVPQDEIDRRVQEVAEILRIHHILNKRPNRLPSGEQQRVALGRAIIRRPQVFLMDEPLTNLDAALRTDMRVELKHLQQELGITTIYVTHDQTEAMTMGDYIAVMNKGVLQQVDTPLMVYRKPRTLFVASFIGDPPMNLFRMSLKPDGLVAENSVFRLHLPPPQLNLIRERAASDAVVVGIRAEDITLNGSGDLQSTVSTRSPLGDQVLYSVFLDDQVVQFSTDLSTHYQPGDLVGLTFPPESLHIFDAVTEQSLL